MSIPQPSPTRSSDPSPRWRGRFTGGALLALAVVAALAAPVGASGPRPAPVTHGAEATGSIGIRLVDAPVSARHDPRAQVYIVDHLPPGTVITRRIEGSNTTGSTARLQLYAAAASIDHGSFLGAAGHTANDLSTWTSVVPGEPDVPAGGKLTAQRSADGEPAVVAAVHNTGGRALDMNGTMELRNGPGGLSAGPFPAILGTTLAIGSTEAVTIALDKALPAGPWDARITLRSGLLEESASASFIFPAAGSSVAVNTTSDASAWPKAVMALLAGGVVATATFLVVRRHRRGPVAGRPAAPLEALGPPLEGEPAGAVVDLRPTVLICDDEPDIRLLYSTVMEAKGAMVVVAADGEECLRVADDVEPDLVLLDVVLPGRSGGEILGELRHRHPRIPVVVMSATISGAELAQFRALGAVEGIEKLRMIARIPGLIERYRRTAYLRRRRPRRIAAGAPVRTGNRRCGSS